MTVYCCPHCNYRAEYATFVTLHCIEVHRLQDIPRVEEMIMKNTMEEEVKLS